MTRNERTEPTKGANKPAPEAEQDLDNLQRWMLDQHVPVIGSWMQRRVLSALTESALQGNPHAVQSLAAALAKHAEPDVQDAVTQTLRRVNFTSGIDAAWGVWVETRNPVLEQILKEKKRTATHPASYRLYSALCLDDRDTVVRGSSDLVPALISACHDADPLIRARAKEGIQNLRNPSSVNVLCRIWTETRHEFLAGVIQESGYVAQKPARVRVLSALKSDQPKVIMQASSEMVLPLIEACEDPDAEIASRASQYLLHLQSQNAVDAFCRLWSESRSARLEDILLKAGYKPHHPLRVRLLVALKTGFTPIAEKTPPEGLVTLLEAVEDSDEVIRANAQKALNHLADEETREALALQVIQTDDPLAREIALANEYTPRAPEQRALFYFLTEQWQAYDELDFDQSMMRAIYETVPAEMRQRIAAKVQAAGRTPYLTILAGVEFRSRAEQVNPNEAALMIRILAENREWSRLWRLAPELALPFSLQIIQILTQNNWKPEEELDLPAFAELSELSQQPMLLSGPELSRVLPLALPRANLKVQGRINEVAFSPAAPLLAIASSHRKLVIWNFHTAKVEKVLEGFKHSVGKVMFTPQGMLVSGERTNTNSICSLMVYQDGEVIPVMQPQRYRHRA